MGILGALGRGVGTVGCRRGLRQGPMGLPLWEKPGLGDRSIQ